MDPTDLQKAVRDMASRGGKATMEREGRDEKGQCIAAKNTGSLGGQANAERGGTSYANSRLQPTKNSIDGQIHELYHTQCGKMSITPINLYPSSEGWPQARCSHCKGPYSVSGFTKEGLEPRWDKKTKTLSWVRGGQSKGTKRQKLA